MSNNYKETILKLLSATNYSLDNLTQNDIRSFENLSHLKPLFVWLSQSLSEANCITPEELEEFKILQLNNKVKYGDELEEAVQAHLHADTASSVPFKESLNDAEQELALLKDQRHYKQALHQSLCSSNALATKDILELDKELQTAENEQKEVIKEVCSASKKLKEKISEVEASFKEIHDDIIGLVPNDEDAKTSADEVLHNVTSDNFNPNKSLSASVWSLTTSSSWQTITGSNPNINYMCQLSFEKYKQINKQFLKRLTKLCSNLSKAGSSQTNNFDCIEVYSIKESLEKQTFTLITKEAELEGIRAARDKVKELQQYLRTEELESRLKREEEEIESRIEDESFNLMDEAELATACQQWAQCKALQAMEQRMKERVEFSKLLIEKMDELLNPLLLKLNSHMILLEVLRYEKQKIEMSINLYKSFHQSLHTQVNQIKSRIGIMQKNFEDYKQFCALPLEEQSPLVEQLASIVVSDKAGLLQTMKHLTESSQREHEVTYQHYVQEKNKLVSSGKDMEESYNVAMSRCEAPADLIASIQRDLDQVDSCIEEINNNIREIILPKEPTDSESED